MLLFLNHPNQIKSIFESLHLPTPSNKFLFSLIVLPRFVQLAPDPLLLRERPYQHDSTASRLLSEVKHVRAWLVLRWGTTLESQVLFSFNNITL